jgi:hypothetical protein
MPVSPTPSLPMRHVRDAARAMARVGEDLITWQAAVLPHATGRLDLHGRVKPDSRPVAVQLRAALAVLQEHQSDLLLCVPSEVSQAGLFLSQWIALVLLVLHVTGHPERQSASVQAMKALLEFDCQEAWVIAPRQWKQGNLRPAEMNGKVVWLGPAHLGVQVPWPDVWVEGGLPAGDDLWLNLEAWIENLSWLQRNGRQELIVTPQAHLGVGVWWHSVPIQARTEALIREKVPSAAAAGQATFHEEHRPWWVWWNTTPAVRQVTLSLKPVPLDYLAQD